MNENCHLYAWIWARDKLMKFGPIRGTHYWTRGGYLLRPVHTRGIGCSAISDAQYKPKARQLTTEQPNELELRHLRRPTR